MDKKPSLIIFDFDGTIAKTIEPLFEIVNNLSEEYKINRITKEMAARIREEGPREIIKESGVSYWRLLFLVNRIKRELGKIIENVHVVENLPNQLQQLKASGCTLGIITSDSRDNVERFLKRKEIFHFFDFIYPGAGIWGKGPIIRKALRKKKLQATDAVYVGDEIRDIKAAREANVKVISVCWGFNTANALQKNNPDHLIHEPDELIKILC